MFCCVTLFLLLAVAGGEPVDQLLLEYSDYYYDLYYGGDYEDNDNDERAAGKDFLDYFLIVTSISPICTIFILLHVRVSCNKYTVHKQIYIEKKEMSWLKLMMFIYSLSTRRHSKMKKEENFIWCLYYKRSCPVYNGHWAGDGDYNNQDERWRVNTHTQTHTHGGREEAQICHLSALAEKSCRRGEGRGWTRGWFLEWLTGYAGKETLSQLPAGNRGGPLPSLIHSYSCQCSAVHCSVPPSRSDFCHLLFISFLSLREGLLPDCSGNKMKISVRNRVNEAEFEI